MTQQYSTPIDPIKDLIVTSGSAISAYPVENTISDRKSSTNEYSIYTLLDLEPLTGTFFIGLNRGIFNQVRDNLKIIKNTEIKKTATRTIDLIEKHIDQNLGKKLPNVYSSIRADDSFLVEWNFEHYKVGISIEEKISDSSWYFVSDEQFGFFYASGNTQTPNFSLILEWLIPFVIKNMED